jgi:tRNA-dihydrouridine synthase
MRFSLRLAPLHGVTNQVFRRAYFRHFPGFDGAMAPFINAVAVNHPAPNHFKDLLPAVNQGIALIPQILGNEAGAFVATAKVLAELGYAEVNWNLGCPYPMVVRKRRGSGLLPYPELVAAFLDRACAESPLPISVKLRLGLRDPAEILALMPILNAHPLKLVYIHPRVGTQMYKGAVNLEAYEAAAALSRHEVAYNGDLKDTETFERLRARFPGVREWMIGRWALYDPFLPGRLRGESPPADPRALLAAFHDDLYAGYRAVLFGPAHLLDKMKEVWTYIGKSFPRSGHLLERIAQARTPEAYARAVDRVFSR